ncbi:hypothetical protein D7I41_11185 [Ochrobactrum sp. MH181795]|nr:hypothetical protein BG46_19140 [Brucella anthropi]PQZ66007.1 hypothetical protein CQ057_05460 [Ochrobactrum sp. MYb49]RNL44360.1 hypothetical protein D7I41_11185 [Ochrobactrum sp. MH181795]KIU69100.1 hypothetical protein TR92_07415 [Brucella anthropi]RCI80939.1 hypothetical protein DNK03_05320 [Brucella anthropi]
MGIINSARSAWALIAFSNRASSDLIIEYPYGDGHKPVLKNAKQEMFAKELAEGLTADGHISEPDLSLILAIKCV